MVHLLECLKADHRGSRRTSRIPLEIPQLARENGDRTHGPRFPAEPRPARLALLFLFGCALLVPWGHGRGTAGAGWNEARRETSRPDEATTAPAGGGNAAPRDSAGIRIAALESDLREDPLNPRPHLELGRTYYKTGHDVAARYHIEQFLGRAATGPDSLAGAMLEARILLRLGLENRATRALQRLTRRPGAPPGASHDLALLLQRDGFPVDAVMAEMRAVELSQGDPDYLREATAQWKEANRLDESLTLARSLVSGGSANAEDHFQLGFLLHRVGRADLAKPAYEEALRRDPGDPEAHYNISLLLEGEGNIDSAAYHLEEVLRLRPHYEPAYFQLASLFLKANRKVEAESTFRRFLLAGTDSVALSEAAGILRSLGQEPDSVQETGRQ